MVAVVVGQRVHHYRMLSSEGEQSEREREVGGKLVVLLLRCVEYMFGQGTRRDIRGGYKSEGD